MQMGKKFWARHVAAAKAEVGSSSAYAKRHGLSVSALYYWQRKLAVISAVNGAVAPGKFIALRMNDAAIGSRINSCTLALPSGIRLEMSGLPSPEWLIALLRASQVTH